MDETLVNEVNSGLRRRPRRILLPNCGKIAPAAEPFVLRSTEILNNEDEASAADESIGSSTIDFNQQRILALEEWSDDVDSLMSELRRSRRVYVLQRARLKSLFQKEYNLLMFLLFVATPVMSRIILYISFNVVACINIESTDLTQLVDSLRRQSILLDIFMRPVVSDIPLLFILGIVFYLQYKRTKSTAKLIDQLDSTMLQNNQRTINLLESILMDVENLT